MPFLPIEIPVNERYNSRLANMLLDKMGWVKGREYDTLVTSDDVVNGRPHPEMIQRCMSNTGVTDPSKVLKAGLVRFLTQFTTFYCECTGVYAKLSAKRCNALSRGFYH